METARLFFGIFLLWGALHSGSLHVEAFQPYIYQYRHQRSIRGGRTHLRASATTASGWPFDEPLPPQAVCVTEASTNTTVLLIGTMHYNPASISMTKSLIQRLDEEDMLGSVVVESCRSRWNNTQELIRNKPYTKNILSSEMLAAAEATSRPVVLGDQTIEDTGTRIKENLKELPGDIISGNYIPRLIESASIAWPKGGPIGFFSGILNPKLLVAAPVSFFKYPVSFLIKSPLVTSAFFATLLGLEYLSGGASVAATTDLSQVAYEVSEEPSVLSYVISLALSAAEVLVFSRLLLEVLLVERNVILTDNIVQQCRLYAPKSQSKGSRKSPGAFSWPWENADQSKEQPTLQLGERQIEYARAPSHGLSASGSQKSKVVVAVLGMAHCNGIAKLLTTKD